VYNAPLKEHRENTGHNMKYKLVWIEPWFTCSIQHYLYPKGSIFTPVDGPHAQKMDDNIVFT